MHSRHRGGRAQAWLRGHRHCRDRREVRALASKQPGREQRRLSFSQRPQTARPPESPRTAVFAIRGTEGGIRTHTRGYLIRF